MLFIILASSVSTSALLLRNCRNSFVSMANDEQHNAINAHNTLIIGGEHEDRLAYAYQLAKTLLCEEQSSAQVCEVCTNCLRVKNHTHPNLIVIEPTSTKDDGVKSGNATIKIDQIREVLIENNKANFESGVSVVLISHMHLATKSAANALLKVIEEAKANKIFITLAPSRTSVLATIASRLRCHQVTPNLESYFAKNAESERKIFAITHARPQARFSFCEQFSADKDALTLELTALMHECHVMLRNKTAPPIFILKLREALEKALASLKINLNPRLTTERLVLREWPSMR